MATHPSTKRAQRRVAMVINMLPLCQNCHLVTRINDICMLIWASFVFSPETWKSCDSHHRNSSIIMMIHLLLLLLPINTLIVEANLDMKV